VRLDRGDVEYEQSHYIHTPLQASDYRTSAPWGDDAESALALAIGGLTNYYAVAIERGHVPRDSWLIPNERFS
jgi:hypothetical protein